MDGAGGVNTGYFSAFIPGDPPAPVQPEVQPPEIPAYLLEGTGGWPGTPIVSAPETGRRCDPWAASRFGLKPQLVAGGGDSDEGCRSDDSMRSVASPLQPSSARPFPRRHPTPVPPVPMPPAGPSSSEEPGGSVEGDSVT
jgi:hypothetical protein